MKGSRLLAGVLSAALLLCAGTAAAAPVEAKPAVLSVRVDGQQVRLYHCSSARAWQLVYTAPREASAQPADFEAQHARAEIVRLSNQLRCQAGLPELEVDPLLAQAAQTRADEMAATGVYSHLRPDGRRSNTITDSLLTGENIYRISDAYLDYIGMDVAQAAVDTWSGSGPHRDNLLSDAYGSFGVGLARGTDSQGRSCWYCVQVFLLAGRTVCCVDAPAA